MSNERAKFEWRIPEGAFTKFILESGLQEERAEEIRDKLVSYINEKVVDPVSQASRVAALAEAAQFCEDNLHEHPYTGLACHAFDAAAIRSLAEAPTKEK